MCRGTTSCGTATMPSGKSGKSVRCSPMRRLEVEPGPRWRRNRHGETTPAIVWFRRDLRVHDHPALVAARSGHERVIPLFVLDDRLIGGRYASPARARFMLGCLQALDAQLRALGSGL